MHHSFKGSHPDDRSWRPQAPASSETPSVSPARILRFEGSSTQWEERILAFLRQHPGSSLLALILHVWPDFLSFPADRRAHTWFWTKAQLNALREHGALICRQEGDGVDLWSPQASPP